MRQKTDAKHQTTTYDPFDRVASTTCPTTTWATSTRSSAPAARRCGRAKNLRGATRIDVEGETEGVTRYIKNGPYIDLALDRRIISFGARQKDSV